MTLFNRPIMLAVACGALLLISVQAHAQSSQDMELLTQQERLAYTQRLQHATSSAERARITAEMNRIIQERRMELRQHQAPQGDAKSKGQGKAK